MSFSSTNLERLLRVGMVDHYGFLSNGLAKLRRQSRRDFGSRTMVAERMSLFVTSSMLYWQELVVGLGHILRG